jgi:hypothetical protein
MIPRPWRTIAKRRADKALDRKAFRALMERLLEELEHDPWKDSRRYHGPRRSSARIMAEQAWSRRGIRPPDDGG